jgi:hypothetical protein
VTKIRINDVTHAISCMYHSFKILIFVVMKTVLDFLRHNLKNEYCSWENIFFIEPNFFTTLFNKEDNFYWINSYEFKFEI